MLDMGVGGMYQGRLVEKTSQVEALLHKCM